MLIHDTEMRDEVPPFGIDPADWEATPPTVRAVVVALLTQVQMLQGRVAELEARLKQHSGNSARPPSSDPPSAPPRPPRPASGRKPGGQPGHPGQHRSLLPPEQVDEFVVHTPTACPQCAAALAADATERGPRLRQQVWELPPVRPHVTEHQFLTLTCPHCQMEVRAERPPEVPPGSFGPQVTALVGMLHGRYRLSDRETVAVLDDLFGLPLSVGSVPSLCATVSRAVDPVYRTIAATVQQQAVANVDETGWKEAGKRRWLWVAVTAVATLFQVAEHRSTAALHAILGAAFAGVVGSDRYCAYNSLPVDQRQVCWAHLKRNWQAFAERDGPVGVWGTAAGLQIDVLFATWHEFREGRLDRVGLQQAMEPIQKDLRALVERGRDELPWEKPRRFCRDLLLWWPALWTFLTVAEVEPTNNAAERALRPAVLWRKGCFGTQSPCGNDFVARILTVTTTCRQQDQPVLPLLTDAVRVYWARSSPPTLLPTP